MPKASLLVVVLSMITPGGQLRPWEDLGNPEQHERIPLEEHYV